MACVMYSYYDHIYDYLLNLFYVLPMKSYKIRIVKNNFHVDLLLAKRSWRNFISPSIFNKQKGVNLCLLVAYEYNSTVLTKLIYALGVVFV